MVVDNKTYIIINIKEDWEYHTDPAQVAGYCCMT